MHVVNESSNRLSAVLQPFDEFLYFPSIGWDHSWERQQTLISHFCRAHSPKSAFVVAPTGLIDHAPWRLETLRKMFDRSASVNGAANAVHVVNPRPDNMTYIEPKFGRGTNSLFAWLACASTNELGTLRQRRKRRLVFASYVNPLVERFLESADFAILDLAERRQANPALSPKMRDLERQWAGKANLLVADNQITIDDYAVDRARSGKLPGRLIPQGFTPPAIKNKPGTKKGKVAAYLGNLHHAIDYDYFKRIIAANSDWTFKLCGQVMSSEADGLLSLPNVTYAGVIGAEEIQGFLADAALGLIPYLRNDWTAGVFPTKLFEYLGHGLPVVSTSIPEVVRYADSRFVTIVDRAGELPLLDVDARQLDSFVEGQTWESRIESYAGAVAEALL